MPGTLCRSTCPGAGFTIRVLSSADIMHNNRRTRPTCIGDKKESEMSETHMIDDLAERFATAILGANMSGLEAILSPDFTIWYNFSDATLSREQALAFFGKYFATVRSEEHTSELQSLM